MIMIPIKIQKQRKEADGKDNGIINIGNAGQRYGLSYAR